MTNNCKKNKYASGLVMHINNSCKNNNCGLFRYKCIIIGALMHGKFIVQFMQNLAFQLCSQIACR